MTVASDDTPGLFGWSTTNILPVGARGDRPIAVAPARHVTLPVFLVEDGLVTDAQFRRLREKRMAGKTLAATDAAAGMSQRAAR